MSGTQQKPKYSDQDNLRDRAMLLKTGVRYRTKLGHFGPYSVGQIANIRLRNIGIITGLRVRLTATQAASGALTASGLAPYTAVSKFSLLDYNTTERVSIPGFWCYINNSFRQHRPYMPTGQGSVDTEQTNAPVSTGGGTVYANYYIPCAKNKWNDLQGAILAQTVVGEQFLNVTFNPTVVGDVTNYATAGTGTLTNFYLDVWQEYIQPQNAQIPLIDLNTVYELLGMYQYYANIATGGSAYYDYPNVRSVIGAYLFFVDNGVGTVNGTDINYLTLVANGNTDMLQSDPLFIRGEMRNREGGDLPAGIYVWDHDANPIQTWIYSQVQMKVDFATITSSPAPYMNVMWESLYRQNTPLPGVAQT